MIDFFNATETLFSDELLHEGEVPWLMMLLAMFMLFLLDFCFEKAPQNHAERDNANWIVWTAVVEWTYIFIFIVFLSRELFCDTQPVRVLLD